MDFKRIFAQADKLVPSGGCSPDFSGLRLDVWRDLQTELKDAPPSAPDWASGIKTIVRCVGRTKFPLSRPSR